MFSLKTRGLPEEMKNTGDVHRHEDFVIENSFEGDVHVSEGCLRFSDCVSVRFF